MAPYSFRSVSRKSCRRASFVVLYATRVVDVARVAIFLKLRRDIHERAFVGLSSGSAWILKCWFLWRHIDKNKCILLVFPSVKFLKIHTLSCNLEVRKMCKFYWRKWYEPNFFIPKTGLFRIKKNSRTIFFRCYYLKEL